MNDVKAVYSLTAFNCIEILDADNDYIIFRHNNDGQRDKKHRARVRETAEGRAYFRTYSLKIPLDECIRV